MRLLIPFVFVTAIAAQEKKPAEPKKEPPPKVMYAVPLVAKAGEKQKLSFRGKNLATVKEVRVTGTDGATAKVLSSKAVPVPNNYPGDRVGDSEVELELELPKSAKPGEVNLVAVNTGGESNAYTLLLADDTPAVKEKEDNSGFDTAQAVPFPCAIEGTIKNERDVDCFKFEGKKGTKIRAEVQAARFGSPVDGFLTLYDANRKILASADDTKDSSDPQVVFTLPADGTYFLVLIDAHDLGGANFGYRLLVTKTE
jgi:hypothetical protein